MVHLAVKDVQVGAVQTTSEDATAVEHKPVPFGPGNITAAISERKIEPPVVAHDDPIGAVQTVSGLFRRPAETAEKIAPLIRHTVTVRVPQESEEG